MALYWWSIWYYFSGCASAGMYRWLFLLYFSLLQALPLYLCLCNLIFQVVVIPYAYYPENSTHLTVGSEHSYNHLLSIWSHRQQDTHPWFLHSLWFITAAVSDFSCAPASLVTSPFIWYIRHYYTYGMKVCLDSSMATLYICACIAGRQYSIRACFKRIPLIYDRANHIATAAASSSYFLLIFAHVFFMLMSEIKKSTICQGYINTLRASLTNCWFFADI